MGSEIRREQNPKPMDRNYREDWIDSWQLGVAEGMQLLVSLLSALNITIIS